MGGKKICTIFPSNSDFLLLVTLAEQNLIFPKYLANVKDFIY